MTQDSTVAKTIVIGDGPAGLGAALLLAKNGVETLVIGVDATSMHRARLYNYLCLTEITGSEFQARSKQQVASFGAHFEAIAATEVVQEKTRFVVTLADGTTRAADYVILAEGKAAPLARALGLATHPFGIVTGPFGRTSIDKLYVVGRATHTRRTQVIISAGQGATAALDILSRINGNEYRDFDEMPKND